MKMIRLCELASTASGTTPPRGRGDYYGGDVPWAKIQDLTAAGRWLRTTAETVTKAAVKDLRLPVFEPGTVLLAMYGSIGAVSITTVPTTTNQAILGIRPGPFLDAGYLWLFLRHVADRLASLGRGGTQSNINAPIVRALLVPAPHIDEQRRVAARLTHQLAAVDRARAAMVSQRETAWAVVEAVLRQSLAGTTTAVTLGDALVEVKDGVGAGWDQYPLIGVARRGLAPAKERAGKSPQRYKLVGLGSIFFNPMRILIGSIAHVDEDDTPGITSPDYVVFRTDAARLNDRWFYQWLRSWRGEALIKSLARGAVRERLLFQRLAPASIDVPTLQVQRFAAASMLAASRLVASLDADLANLEALPAALLRRAFAQFEAA